MKVLLFLFLGIGLLSGAESILSYKSHIKVNRDGWLDVTETIKVVAEGNMIKRGIYRDFPRTYKVRWGFREKRPFEVTSVTRNGLSEPYQVKQINLGTRVLIGSEDHFLPTNSEQEYEIRYRTRFQLITAVDGMDELNWNATGNEWGFPIEKIEVTVELPDGIGIEIVKAWTGEYGAKGEDYESGFEGNLANFQSTSRMDPGEGMTVIALWSTGLLDAAAYEKPGLFESNPGLITGMIFVGIGMFFYVVMWFLVGRDPPKGVIIPRWEPPEGFSPGGVRFLRNLRFDDRCFSSGLLGLAAGGHLKMEENRGDYSVTKRKGPPPMNPVEAALFSKIFSSKKKVVLRPTAHKIISRARGAFTKALTGKIDRSYFLANFKGWLPGIIFGVVGILIMMLSSANGSHTFMSFLFFLFIAFATFASISTIMIAIQSRGWEGLKSGVKGGWFAILLWAVGFGLFVYNAGMWVGVFFLIVFISGFVFHHLIKQPTKKGRAIIDEIEGFREYLKVAEEDRLNLENPPEKTPELFERFLPYALALDVEQEWSEKFDDVLKAAGKEQGESTYRPSYYSGNFSSTSQALSGAALGGALTSALTSAAVAPSSSGSSSGGGGGFSGGGGGGGGGGGW